MQLIPRIAQALADDERLTQQDLADFASFATDIESEQAEIVQQINDARK